MPKGVEHIVWDKGTPGMGRVRTSVMPKGVEHDDNPSLGDDVKA